MSKNELTMAQPLLSGTEASQDGQTKDTIECEPDSSQVNGAESGRVLPWVLLLFAGSGCAALIYEIVWLQLLQLVIGLTTVSLGVLLGTFMGGICLGSLLLPRLISARRHPLRVFAALELGIGTIGIAVLFGMPHVAQIYSTHGGHGFFGVFLRGTLAALCLLPPTLLMGATLPAISRWVETTQKGVSWLGFFYGGNIAGAVFGCLFAGFYLLRIHDMARATYVAASINLAVALVGFVLASLTTHRSRQASRPRGSRGDEHLLYQPEIRNPKVEIEESHVTPAARAGMEKDEPHRRRLWTVYIAIALSGLTALGAEVVWTRLLSLMLGATVYTFSIILAVFLAGLGIGSGAGSLLSRSTFRPRIALCCCQMLLAGAVAWAAYMIARSLPYWPINPALSMSPWYSFQLDLVRCWWAILPAAILWGASFPLALAAVASRGHDPGRLVGGIYAANTMGAILGALGFSLLVIPLIGTQWAQRLLIGFSAAAGISGILDPIFPRRRALEQDRRFGLGGPRGWTCFFTCLERVPRALGLDCYGRFMATYRNRLAPGIRNEKDVPSAICRARHLCYLCGRRAERVGRRDQIDLGRAEFPFRRQGPGVERTTRYAIATPAGAHLGPRPPEARIGAGRGLRSRHNRGHVCLTSGHQTHRHLRHRAIGSEVCGSDVRERKLRRGQ